MLFSSDPVANYINAAFEPVWESVRPVPMVTIDFGNGTTITRTLHGNIATYLCGADGTVYDILPGIYTAAEYTRQLQQFTLLYRYTQQAPAQPQPNPGQPNGGASLAFAGKAAQAPAVDPVSARLREYHTHQAALLKANQPADLLAFARDPSGGRGKALIERRVELVAAGKLNGNRADAAAVTAMPTRPEDLADWKELTEDTRINESVRRQMIHEKLAAVGQAKPADVMKWLYKDVLHADLDDPTLGIADVLNKRYPFAAEDATPRP